MALALGWRTSSVYNLQSRYQQQGAGVLLGTGRGGRRHAWLSPEQEQRLLHSFTATAEQGGMVEAGALVRAYEQAVGHPVALSTIYRLLARHGWRKLVSSPTPSGRQPRGTGSVQKKLRRVVRTECQRQRQRGLGLRLMFEDEARFGRMVEPRRAWTPPDLRPLVATRIEREYGYAYAYAAVSPHDGVLDSLVLPEVNAALMSLFLAEVARRHPREFIFMVLDGAGWHRAGDLVIAEQMRLYPLPARSPELNPAEHVWEELRDKWMHNRLFQSQEEVERQLMRGLAELEQDAERMASLTGFAWIRRIPLTIS